MNFQTHYTYSELIDQNDFFKQFFNPHALFRYDSNFFELLYSPSADEFILIEDMHWHFSTEYSLKHMKFVWPQNQGILPETLDYLSQEGYGLEKLELYSITPRSFKGKSHPDIRVQSVDETTLDVFKHINYIEDRETSLSFAESKQPFYDLIVQDPSVTLKLAYMNDVPAGSCILIEQEETLEIDDLFTLPDFRKKGIAETLQTDVMLAAEQSGKQVILAADAEDSPREMYKRQGYHYEGFRIGAIRTIKEDE